MSIYTLGVVLEAADPMIIARVMRDLITLKVVTSKQRMDFQIACVDASMDSKLNELKIRRTPDLNQADYWRVYYSHNVPDAPETANEIETIQVEPPPGAPRPLRKDSSFSEDVLYRDVRRVYESVPWEKVPPRGPADPISQDF